MCKACPKFVSAVCEGVRLSPRKLFDIEQEQTGQDRSVAGSVCILAKPAREGLEFGPEDM